MIYIRKNFGFFLSIFVILILETFGGRVIKTDTPIKGTNLEEFKTSGWKVHGTAKSYNEPSEFKPTLEKLESLDGVWVESNLVNPSSELYFSYIFDTSGFCDITAARLSLTYYAEQATAYFYPCDGSSAYCYLEPPNAIQWSTVSSQIVIPIPLEKIEISGVVLPNGYIIFEEVTITHNGKEGNDCITTTTTQATTENTTPDGTEETANPEITTTDNIPSTDSTTVPTTPEETEITQPSFEPSTDLTTESTTDHTTESTQATTENTTPDGTEETSDQEITPTTESTTTEDPITTSKETITTSEVPTTYEPTTEPPVTTTEDPDSCDHDCEYVGIDCHNYYSCINFTRKEYHECNAEHGLAFNPALKLCDRIENVEGCRPETTEPPTTSPPEENCICEYKPHETDCSKFYFCLDSCRNSSCQVRACPGDLLWSVDFYGDGSAHQQCSLPENANCVSAGAGGALLEFSCYKKANGLYQNERDCKSYWKCEEGQELLFECTKGYVYNADMKSCHVSSKSLRFCTNNEQV